MGGLLVRLYTERDDADVVAVVLVDPTHESDVISFTISAMSCSET